MSAKEQEPINTLELNGVTVTLLGTAHVSKASADKVTELVGSAQYDCIAIELCQSRHKSIIDPNQLAKMDLFQVIREGKAAMVAASLALGAFQQRMADQLGVRPGVEMHAAIEGANELNLPLILIDREIGITLKRVYRRVPWWQRLNLVAGLLASVVTRHEVSKEEIEKLKEGDILESTFTQFAEEAEELYEPLVDERDRYMAARLMQTIYSGKHKNILAVIGAGHLKGIQSYFDKWLKQEKSFDADKLISTLDAIPPANRWPKAIPWVIVVLVLVGFVIGFSRNSDLGWELVVDWVVINGGLSALGALLAMGHPVTVLGAFIAAPLTSLNPTIGAGMVTGAIETYVRRPTVEDFTQLRSDATKVRGWWRNQVTRILLVFIFSTLGSAIGTYVAGFRIFEKLTTG